ncbi:MAG: MlaD family protein [Verrucomicrobiae bacterium]|nr:MlaD family protein [Verrucomicrobiae bacterium]
MSSQTNIERKVGLFVFLGILVVCSLIIHFGKVGDRFRGGFPVQVEFGNAGGLVKGAQVLFAGVLVGKVDRIKLDSENDKVMIEVDLFEGSGVRRDARFMIKQSGLLGDKHIVILQGSRSEPLLKAGDRIRGVDPFDFTDMANQAGDTIRELNKAIRKLSTEIGDKDAIGNISKGIKSFTELTEKLKTNSERLDAILRRVQKGNGTVGKLLTNDGLFEEMTKLVHNWRVYGILHQEKSEQRYPSPRQTNRPQ